MKKLTTLFIFLCAFVVGSKAQTFFLNTGTGCVPHNTYITNTGTAGTIFDWDMGDGTFYSNMYEPPIHTYTYGATFTITMFAYDGAYNFLGAYTESITVDGPAWISGNLEQACPGTSVNFYVSVPYTPPSFNWSMSDGYSTTTSAPYVDHVFTTPGMNYVYCTYTNLCGQSYTVVDSVFISSSLPYYSAYIDINASATTACPGSELFFNGSSPSGVSFSWDFDNGNTSTNLYTSSVFPSVGIYDVALTAVNGCGVDTTIYETIDINNTIIPPVVSIDGVTEVCPGEQFFLTSYSSGELSFTWDFGDGTAPLSTNNPFAYHEYAALGVYTVELITENLCGNTSTSSYVVEASATAPVVNVSHYVSTNNLCPGDVLEYGVSGDYNYYVDFGDGTIATEGYTHIYTTTGVYTMKIVVQNACGQQEIITESINVSDAITITGPVSAYAYPTTVCPGEDIAFYTSENYSTYHWDFADGYEATNEEIEHPFNSTGSYNVQLTVTNGCGASATATIPVVVGGNLPISNMNWDVFTSEICPGDSLYVSFDPNSNMEVTWDFGDGTSSNEYLENHVYDTPGTYTINLTAVNGCGSDSTVSASVNVGNGVTPDFSVIEFGVQELGCVSDNLFFAVKPAGLGEYHWDFGDGNSGISDQLLYVEGEPYMVTFHSFATAGTYYPTLTITNSCGNSADTTISMEVGSVNSGNPVDLFFWYDETAINCEDHPMTFFAVGAGTYVWDFGDGSGNLITYSSFTPVYHTYNEGGNYNVVVTGINACGSATEDNIGVYIPDSDISVVTNAVTDADCGDNNGVAIVSASGGIQPYQFSWTNGDQGVIADSLSSGIYVVTVTDNNGCSTEAIATVSDDQGPVILLENIVHNECYGQDNGVISVSIFGGAPPYDILWSNGDATEDIFNLEAGPYELFVTDANGCFSVETFVVEQPQESVVSIYSQNATCGLNNGAAVAVISDAVPPFNFIWPNASGSSNETAGLAPGVYTLMVIDGNTCLHEENFVVNEDGGPVIVVDSITDPTCTGDLSAIYLTTIGGTAPFDYDWSNGSINEDLTGVLPGEYFVEITSNDGCSSFEYFDVVMSAPEETDICMVTVDTIGTSNIVVWNPLTASDVVSYNIYKESSLSGLYYLIANQSADSISQYIDYASNPAIKSWRYKVAAVDDCGNEAPLSDPHKTIHLTTNLGISGEVNLIWDHYNGFSYDTYYIWRYHPSTDWEKIDSVSALNFSYTDLTPPDDSNMVYIVEIVPPSTCTAFKVQDHNSSRSNKSAINMPGGPSDLGVTEPEYESLSIYPNPTSGMVQLMYSTLISEVRIYSASGQLIYASENNTNTMAIDCSSFARGVYTIQLNTPNGLIYSKLVKQ